MASENPFPFFSPEPMPGLSVWISRRRAGALAFADVPGYRVVAGEPGCSREALREVVVEFEEEARRLGRRTLYFGIPAHSLPAFDPERRRGRLRLGEAPVFETDRWTRPAQFPPGIRRQIRRAENKGVEARPWIHRPKDMRELHACLRAWLLRKGLPPLRFATTPFLLDPWPEHGIWVAEMAGKVMGFLVPSAGLGQCGRIDAIVRAPGAPNGCAELLVAAALRAAGGRGWPRMTLGLAPLSRRAASPAANPPWFRSLAALARRFGGARYSFAGLEAFKAKFRPDAWLPLYCLAQRETFSPRDFLAMTRAFTQPSLARYSARTLAWSLGFRRTG